jgi:hypothetical protein
MANERKRIADLSLVADAGLVWKARAEQAEAELATALDALWWCRKAALDIADAARATPRIMQVRELADAAEGIATRAQNALTSRG